MLVEYTDIADVFYCKGERWIFIYLIWIAEAVIKNASVINSGIAIVMITASFIRDAGNYLTHRRETRN